ncbi:IQ motif, EF-hand binding site [Artemisia annua]|uniref:IQ motif, EF-hand binding site n=1 Tax=Artemisia annua TaxID=35608 RepID=A0A2U1L0D8_ARTAN|nr:IQ motif, EF-hand binding site [Artemisia annua]
MRSHGDHRTLIMARRVREIENVMTLWFMKGSEWGKNKGKVAESWGRVERIPGNGNVPERVRLRSNLPICYGIDGLDGGSPLLFTSRASIKSSSEMISGFLSSDVMHGVGNLLTHLTIIGYKVSYQQNPLVKYVLKVTDLFNDLKDGVLLCRVIQLLKHDPSILKSGVPLHDQDGTEVITEDVVYKERELVISLLWNMFVHLQLPFLINNKLVSDEITNIRGPAKHPNTSSQLELLSG